MSAHGTGSAGLKLVDACAVAGPGGNPYRDGSFEYYAGEKIRRNDPRAVGPFILAAREFEKTAEKQTL